MVEQECRIEYGKHVFSERRGDVIALHYALQAWPDLQHKLVEHELGHTGSVIKDINLDFNRKRVNPSLNQLLAFFMEHPSAFVWWVMPISFDDKFKCCYYDIAALFTYLIGLSLLIGFLSYIGL